MRKPTKRASKSTPPVRPRSNHGRQRQRLIDACISALHIYGPSRTTVEKVVAFAKMSPGIVRFYFASKAAMLVASLQFLAAEFEEQLLMPVTKLKSRPVAALELMVDLYLDPEIASPRKVSVWYAFWGEASSRQEYYDICGQKDESFAALVRELIERLVLSSGRPHADPDAIALGLIGVLEMLWQEFAFRNEADIDRPAAKARAMAYLRSIFPGEFPAPMRAPVAEPEGRRLPAWVYANDGQFARERDEVFHDSWQLAGHVGQIPHPGDYISVDFGIDRALVVRDGRGRIRALRNSCSEAPHVLKPFGAGHDEGFHCQLHGVRFGLDGHRHGTRASGDLAPLSVHVAGDLILVRSAERSRAHAGFGDPWALMPVVARSRQLISPQDSAVAADWKVVVEQWLETPQAAAAPWSSAAFDALVGEGAADARRRQYIAPNHWVEQRADGATLLQIVPVGPGRSVLRRFEFTLCADERAARAARYLALRQNRYCSRASITVAESTQTGIAAFGQTAMGRASQSAELSAFRRRLTALVPAITQPRAPHDG